MNELFRHAHADLGDVRLHYVTAGVKKAQREYLRTYRQPGAMRAGFNLYRASPQDSADNEAQLAQGKVQMSVLCYGSAKRRGARHGRHGIMAMRSHPRARRIAENCSGRRIQIQD